jgi:hypothetical protein
MWFEMNTMMVSKQALLIEERKFPNKATLRAFWTMQCNAMNTDSTRRTRCAGRFALCIAVLWNLSFSLN